LSSQDGESKPPLNQPCPGNSGSSISLSDSSVASVPVSGYSASLCNTCQTDLRACLQFALSYNSRPHYTRFDFHKKLLTAFNHSAKTCFICAHLLQKSRQNLDIFSRSRGIPQFYMTKIHPSIYGLENDLFKKGLFDVEAIVQFFDKDYKEICQESSTEQCFEKFLVQSKSL
jgi:hypothetical protein